MKHPPQRKLISRRNFLKNGALCSLAGILPLSYSLRAAPLSTSPNLFADLSLDGGPDFRHLFVPPYDSNPNSYASVFWRSRAGAHNISNSTDQSALQSRYEDSYSPITLGDTQLGVLKQCGWLYDQIKKGNVAIINNAVLSTNRDHAHSILIKDSASLDASAHDGERSGWGGRLAQQANRNIVSLTQNVRLFCNGEKAGDPLKHSNERVIDMSDSRKVSLQEFDLTTADNNSDPWRKYWDDAKIKRTLKAYYAAKGIEMDTQSPYYPIIQNEISLRRFGQNIDNRLADYPEPEALTAFFDWDDQSGNLNRRSFGQQMRNLYDAVICRDIIDLSVASLDYGGWDSHKKTPAWIEGKFNDLFGTGKGFDIFFQELDKVDPIASSRLVILVTGEFGRQLAANGTQGTDHGTGNSSLLIGNPVVGGCYGELFPENELGGGNVDPKHTFSEPNSDIQGLTSMNQIQARICDWVSPGSSDNVVPGWRSAMLERGVDFSNLLSN